VTCADADDENDAEEEISGVHADDKETDFTAEKSDTLSLIQGPGSEPWATPTISHQPDGELAPKTTEIRPPDPNARAGNDKTGGSDVKSSTQPEQSPVSRDVLSGAATEAGASEKDELWFSTVADAAAWLSSGARAVRSWWSTWKGTGRARLRASVKKSLRIEENDVAFAFCVKRVEGAADDCRRLSRDQARTSSWWRSFALFKSLVVSRSTH